MEQLTSNNPLTVEFIRSFELSDDALFQSEHEFHMNDIRKLQGQLGDAHSSQAPITLRNKLQQGIQRSFAFDTINILDEENLEGMTDLRDELEPLQSDMLIVEKIFEDQARAEDLGNSKRLAALAGAVSRTAIYRTINLLSGVGDADKFLKYSFRRFEGMEAVLPEEEVCLLKDVLLDMRGEKL
jgi:hypothetical protein